jgi:uncharacterized protein YjaG (DUF416 family)
LSRLRTHLAYVAQAVAALPKPGRLAFAAACAERLLPLYGRFVEENGWGDLSLLRRVVDSVWHASLGEPIDLGDLRAIALKAEDAAPDTEEFTHPLTSAALSAAAATRGALDCVLGEETCAQPATDVLDALLLTISSPERSEATEHDALVQKEIADQNGVLERLRRGDDIHTIRRDAVQRSVNLASEVELALARERRGRAGC